MKNFGWILSFLLFTLSIQAQNFANDCVNAIVICGNENIVSNATGFGNTQEISGCGSFEHNTIWIKINIVQAGTLGFNLIPSDPDLNVDYDFWVFGPNKNCGTTLGNPIRCNTVSPLPPPYGANLSSNVTGMNGSTLATQSGPGPGSPGSTGYVRWLDVTPGQFYYIAIDRPGGEGGFELEWIGSAMAGTGAFPTSPTANVIPDYEVCSSTPDIGIFDLDSVRSSINPDLTSNAITFYETYELAFDELDPLPNIINNTANPQTVFAKVKNNTTGCFSITSFRLVVNPIPEVTMSVSNSTICVGGNITVSFTGTPGAILQYQINSDPLISATLSTAGTFSFSQTISNTTTFSLNNVKTFDNLGDVICTQQYTNSITVTATQVPTATISYAATSFCANTTSVQNVSVTGTNAFENGTFSALPMGLLLNSTTGAITPSGSLLGDYEITYIIPASGGCDAIPVTTLVSITPVPTATISYAATSFCANTTSVQNVSVTGTNAFENGTFSALPTGLLLNSSTGAITPSGSLPGDYEITYIIPASGGCDAIPVTTLVSITPVPTATISYAATSFCANTTSVQNVSVTGTNAFENGTFSALPMGLLLNSSTGAITPSGSLPGDYEITYIIPASGGCDAIPVTTLVSITPVPTATISYAATSFCANTTSVQNVSVTGTNAFENGTFSALPMGLLLNSTTGAITPSGSLPGDYEITYIIPASGGCDAIPVTTLVSIVLQPTLTLTSAPSTTNQTICAGSAITPIQYTLGSGATNIDFGLSGLPAGLEYSISGNLVTIFGTPSSLIPGILNYTIVVTGNSCGNPSLSGTITLTTGIQPFFNPVAAVCEGVTPSLPTLSNNFIPITGFWTQTGATSSSITYEFSPDENQCALPGTTMIVEINPRPAVIVDNLPVQNTICSGESINLLLSSLVPGAEFFWTSSNANGVSGHSDSTPGTPLTFINQTLTLNPGVTSPREVTYNIYAEANGCLGVEFPITITVNPVPNVVVKGDNPLTICSGEIIDISFEGSVSGTIFNWVVQSSTGVSGAFDGQGSAMTQQLSTTGFSQGQVVYEVTPTFNGCTGASVLVTVFVNPIPQLLGDNSNHPQLCSGVDLTSIAFSSLHPNPNTIYSWTATQVGVMGAEDGTFTGQDLVIQQLLSTTSLSQGYVDYEITPILNNCSGTPVMVRVYVNPLPNPVLTDGTICVDPSGNTFQTYTFNSGLNNDDYDFVWYFNGVAIPNSNNFTYSANAVGTYGVIATNSLTNCPSSDEANMVTAIVGITTPATGISVIQTDYFSGNATVTVTVIGGSGTFMYSLDEGALQDSNLFTNVSSGSHIVTVIDTEGCTYFTYDLFIIGYPNFFTPNGDGFNDVWQIEGLQSRDSINIFDRYGKLIKQLRGDEFWDGSYNQELLPSTDYWFMVNYQENGITKQFKGHFSLIR